MILNCQLNVKLFYGYIKSYHIDMIKRIYKLKEEMEHEDTLSYYGLCPRNVKIMGVWLPKKLMMLENHEFKRS